MKAMSLVADDDDDGEQLKSTSTMDVTVRIG